MVNVPTLNRHSSTGTSAVRDTAALQHRTDGVGGRVGGGPLLHEAARKSPEDARHSHLGDQLLWPLRRPVQLEPGAVAELSRREAIRVALLHLCWVLSVHDGGYARLGRDIAKVVAARE